VATVNGQEGRHLVVHARRIGSWWALDADGVAGVHTQVRRLDQADAQVRDAAAGVLGVAPGSMTIEIRPDLPARARAALRRTATARSSAAVAQARAAKLTREAALTLVQDEGLTVRDAGRLLGISHQRVAQLIGERP
jgi:hypothetical protein